MHFIKAVLLLLASSCLMSAQERVVFEAPTAPPGWKPIPAGKALSQMEKDALRVEIKPATDGTSDFWPRIALEGPPLDLSDYSQIVFEVENPLDVAQSIAVKARAVPEDNAGQVHELPPRGTIKVRLNIGDGAPVDQSSIRELMLYQFKPITTHIYRLKSITAVTNPDFVSSRAALERRIVQVRRELEELKDASPAKGVEEKSIQEAQTLLDQTESAFAKRRPGYVPSVRKWLLRTEETIARTAMNRRGRDLVVWSSPLGLPIRKGTLPSPGDAELSKLDEWVCLNQYRVLCVNFSAAEKPQTLRVKLDGLDNLASLRPAHFVIARDGSETADAIGTPVRELTVQVEPWQTEQVLLWIDTKRPGSQPGDYLGTLQVSRDGEPETTFPLRVEVAAVRLAARPPIGLTNWAYFHTGSTPATQGLEAETVANLRDYGMDTWNLDHSQAPLPRLNAQGGYEGLDEKSVRIFSKVMDTLQIRPEEFVVVWLGFQKQQLRDTLRKPGVLEAYLKDLAALLDRHHVAPDKRYLMLWDEPKLPEMREEAEWMAKIREIDPSFLFYENGSALPPDEKELRAFGELTDCWFPNWDQLFVARPEDAARYERLTIKRRGFYRCLMSRNNRGVNIHEYYRLMPWHLMERGFDTLGFWVHNVAQSDEWDGRKGSSSGGAIVYSKDGKLLSSRRWELFREGLEDYKTALAAFGEEKALDARSHPELLKLCRDVTTRPDEYATADAARRALIGIALQRVKEAAKD